jgi:hypothetical protein
MEMRMDSLLRCSNKLIFAKLLVSCVIQGAMELSIRDRISLINERFLYLGNVLLLAFLGRIMVSSFEQTPVSDIATSKKCFVGAMIATAGRWAIASDDSDSTSPASDISPDRLVPGRSVPGGPNPATQDRGVPV